MTSEHPASATFLICRSMQRLCALPLEHVLETMRALPLEALPDMPHFMLGMSIIRGEAVPVVHLAKLFGSAAEAVAPPARYVTLKLDQRRVALAVDAVIGVRTLAPESLAAIPPLLSEMDRTAMAAIGMLDAELLLVLRETHLIPERVWDAIDAKEAPA